MHNDWDSFLDHLGAIRDDDGTVTGFAGADTPVTETGIALCDQLGVITVTGPDAEKFLQGQITTDMRDVTAGHVRAGMHLSLKGRALVGFRIAPTADGFALVLPASTREACLGYLKKYAVFSRVVLAVATDRACLRSNGPASDAVAQQLGLKAPSPGESVFRDDALLMGLVGGDCLAVVPRQWLESHWKSIVADAHPGGSLQARLMAIMAGEGEIVPAIADRFLPQEMNYDRTAGVSFKKGCYTGQEVVARMHFRGKVKQRLMHVRMDMSLAPAPGMPLRDEAGQARGEVVDAVAFNGAVEALVVIRLDEALPTTLRIEGRQVTVTEQPLPYTLPKINATDENSNNSDE